MMKIDKTGNKQGCTWKNKLQETAEHKMTRIRKF